MIEYDDLNLIVFYKILSDEKNIHLLGIENKEKAVENWELIKEEYRKRHQSPEAKSLLSAYKKALGSYLDFEKKVSLLKFMLLAKDLSKEAFEASNMKFTGDDKTDYDNLKKEIDKSKSKKEIFTARLNKLQGEISSKNKNEDEDCLNRQKLNECLASLELAGYTINDYNTITCGKYDAMTRVISKQNNGKRSNNR